MSAKFRSAWMPPVVAHAPMVTSVADCSRIRRMLSASLGVVTEPSTSETSYGPGRWVEVASVKWTMSTSAASASSSSWQSSRVSWQPSHEASFHTASFGRAMSELPHRKQRSRSLVVDDRSVPAQQQWAQLAVPALGYAAAHIPLHRNPDASRGEAARVQSTGGEPQHDLRAADQSGGYGRVDIRGVDQLGDHAHVARPACRGPVDGDLYLSSAVPPC